MQLCPLQCGPNGQMAILLVITVILTVRGVGLMVIIISTVISLHHGEVPCCVVLISR
jgi:hypothetical protein